MDDTANTAGGREAVRWWTEAMDRETRVQAQLIHIGRLGSKGLIALSDQQAAALRTWQRLMGLQATREQVWSRCWRDREAERIQRDLSERSLRESLTSAKAETVVCMELAFSRLTESQFCQARTVIEENNRKAREQERAQSLRRIETLERKERDCQSHPICRWVRGHWSTNWRNQEENTVREQGERQTQGDSTETDTGRYETGDFKIKFREESSMALTLT